MIFAVVCAGSFYCYRAGLLALAGLIIYGVVIFVLYMRIKPVVLSELVNFALDYGQVQKSLLHELEIPYGVLDENGNLLWANAKMKEIADVKAAERGIANLFPELKKEQSAVRRCKGCRNVSY